ncbi:MAG: SWIM zinc finger family protein, partial [Saprospiraceae bacterium]
TNIDYSAALYNEFQKIRDYKQTEFKVDPSGFEVATENEDVYKEVKIDLPDSWVRGFLQVSSAMTLDGGAIFDLLPMDIYNICLHLRRFKEKHGPRSLRWILKPGEPIRVILEPWNKEIVCSRSIYQGPKALEIRSWGRRRILILERLISVTKKFTVTLLGTGLPSFYVADMGNMDFTLGLSGWSANDWSRAGNFDLMAPRMKVDEMTKKTVFNALKENWVEDLDSLANRLGLGKDVVAGALAAYTQAGRVIYDMRLKKYRVRELSRDPLPMDALRFSSPVEEAATKILEQNNVTVNVAETGGVKHLTGTVRHRSRTYHPELFIDTDEKIVRGTCSCNHYNMNQLRKGPCEHMLSLRMKMNQENPMF